MIRLATTKARRDFSAVEDALDVKEGKPATANAAVTDAGVLKNPVPLWYAPYHTMNRGNPRTPNTLLAPRPRNCICPWAEAGVPSPSRPA